MKLGSMAFAAFGLSTALIAQVATGPVQTYVQTLHKAKSLTASLKLADSTAGNSEIELTYSKDKLFKIESKTSLTVSDGTHLWKLNKTANTYTEEDASVSPTAEDKLLAFAGFFNDKIFDKAASISSSGTKTLGDATADSWSISLSDKNTLNLFLDQGTGLADGEQLIGSDHTVVVLVKKVKLSDKALPDSDFAFVPPAGATKVTLAADYAAVDKIFQDNCMPCHDSANARGDLDLSTYATVMAKRGVVVPGKPEDSALYLYVTGDRTPRMPRGRPALSTDQIKTIHDWIAAGAKGPAGSTQPSSN